MITNFKLFESHSDWKVGDIIVAVNGIRRMAPLDYYSSRGILVKDYSYEIVSIDNALIRVKDKDDKYVRDSYNEKGKIKRKKFFLKKDFITLEEWELKNSAQKYNL